MFLVTLHRKLTLAAVTCCALMICVIPAFADVPIGGTQDPNAAAQITPPLQVTPEGDIVFRSTVPAVTVATSARHAETNFRAYAVAVKRLKARILASGKSAKSWAQVMGTTVQPLRSRRLSSMGLTGLKRMALEWKSRADSIRIRAQHPPHLNQFMCIHHYEGSWTDGGPPYYGGLQMDLGFQRTYNPRLLRLKGTADHWTPLEQIWTAEKAEKSRGFWPWPNTAHYCGYI